MLYVYIRVDSVLTVFLTIEFSKITHINALYSRGRNETINTEGIKIYRYIHKS